MILLLMVEGGRASPKLGEGGVGEVAKVVTSTERHYQNLKNKTN